MKLFLSIVLVACGFVVDPLCVAQTVHPRAKEADAFVRENQAKRAENPAGLSFTINFKDNQKQFHQGEVMKLELSFASSKPGFVLDMASYDRSGRLDSDAFVIDQPEAVVDPLYDYFHSSPYGFIGGGLRSIPELGNKPQLVNADLNEWLRFDKVGHYRLYVVSGRVGHKRPAREPARSVVSNIVEFEVLPADKKWANQQLAQALTGLSESDDENLMVALNNRDACRVLRFLGTRAAVSEMIKRFRGETSTCDFEYQFGLIGSRHREFVIEELEKALSVPEQPISTSFIGTLTLLDFARQRIPLPPYPQGDKEQIRQWESLRDQHNNIYKGLLANYLRQLLAAIPQKDERARATSIQTLLEYRSEAAIKDLSTVVGLLPDVFSRLSLDSQNRLLTSQWKALRGPAMLPVLRGILKQPDIKNSNYLQTNLRTTALRRLYELSPEEGRRLILDEIREPHLGVSITVLGSLPEQTLPEFDAALLENLKHSADNASLVARYASDGILPQVKAFYEAPGVGRWSCDVQTSLIAYFLRVDPASGSDYLKQALAARGKNQSRCYTSILTAIARLQAPREVEDIATAALDDDDPEVVASAAQVLKDYGSADAEKALWRRFEKWHDAMESRSEELRNQSAGVPAYGASDLSGQAMIEQELRTALVQGKAWVADPEMLKRVRDLCLTDGGRKELDGFIRTWNQQITVFLNPDGEPVSISVAHYSPSSIDQLKHRLIRFPSGTVFRWTVLSGYNEVSAPEMFQQMKTYVEDHGMKLEREAPKVDQ